MNNKTLIPPIKSQGIKTKLVPWIKYLISNAEIDPNVGRWIEPFFGTGVVGFNAGFKSNIVGDTNPHIIALYEKIKSGDITQYNVREYFTLHDKLLQIANNNGYEHYLNVRNKFNTSFDSFDFIFLSRAGFNGMMRFNSKGKWNIPFCKKPNRFAPAYITKICNQVAGVERIINSGIWVFNNKSFIDTIKDAKEGDLIYCDPPYYGRHVDYYNGWTEDDERELYHLLKITKAKFILSTWHHNKYRENEMINKYWNEFNIVTKDHFYHGGGKLENRQSIVEALIFNFELKSLEGKSQELDLFSTTF